MTIFQSIEPVFRAALSRASCENPALPPPTRDARHRETYVRHSVLVARDGLWTTAVYERTDIVFPPARESCPKSTFNINRLPYESRFGFFFFFFCNTFDDLLMTKHTGCDSWTVLGSNRRTGYILYMIIILHVRLVFSRDGFFLSLSQYFAENFGRTSSTRLQNSKNSFRVPVPMYYS